MDLNKIRELAEDQSLTVATRADGTLEVEVGVYLRPAAEGLEARFAADDDVWRPVPSRMVTDLLRSLSGRAF